MAFDAGKQVLALEWNFRPHVDANGVTPEPSDHAVSHFLYESASIYDDFRDQDGELLTLVDLTEEQYQSISERLLDLVAELTQDCPSREQIAALPHRIQKAYIAWLRKELTDPEAPSGATKGSRAPLRSVAPFTRPAGS
jgi:hypothetical protein